MFNMIEEERRLNSCFPDNNKNKTSKTTTNIVRHLSPKDRTKMNSSLMYEILMYLNSFYFGLYAIFEVGVVVLKAIFAKYAEGELTREVSILLAFLVVETIRIVCGRRSSLSDRGWQAITSVILTLPSLAIVIYLCCFQIVILKLEIILSALMIAVEIAEMIYAGIFICTMCQPVTYT